MNLLKKISPAKKDFFIFTLIVFGVIVYLFISSAPKPLNPQNKQPPRLLYTYPPNPGDQVFEFPTDAINFIFDQEISVDNINITTNPKIATRYKLSNDKKTLIVFPSPGWQYDIKNSITIEGITNQLLQFEFTPLKPDYSKPMGVPQEPKYFY